MSELPRPSAVTVQRAALFVAVAGAVVCAIAYLVDAEQFFRGWLVAWMFWLGLSLGSLAVLMVHNLTGGRWGNASFAAIDSGVRTVPLAALAIIPILVGLDSIYPWTEISPTDLVMKHKEAYFNYPILEIKFFYWRAAFYVLCWIGLAFWVLSLRRRAVESGDATVGRRLRRLSALGLALYGLTITFASIDYGMSLEPHWFSAIYGVIFMVSQALMGICTALLFTLLFSSTSGGRPAFPSKQGMSDLGTLMFAFTMLFAYMSFIQFLIIWYADLPEEIPYYIRRLTGGWQYLAIALLLLHYALPWSLLMSAHIRRNPRALVWISLSLVVMQWFFLLWLIQPAFEHPGLYWPWMDLAATAALGGAWVALFLARYQKYISGEVDAAGEVAHG